MNKADYLKLVNSSEVFQHLDEEMQQTVLNAEGAELEKFAAIFQEENDLILAAKKELLEKNEAVLKAMGVDMQQLSKKYLTALEEEVKQADENEAESLLKGI